MAFTREKMMSSLFLLAIMLISLMFSTYQEGIIAEQEPKNTKIPKVQFETGHPVSHLLGYDHEN